MADGIFCSEGGGLRDVVVADAFALVLWRCGFSGGGGGVGGSGFLGGCRLCKLV